MITDAQFDEQQERIRALMRKWQFNMALNYWDIDHHYAQSKADMVKEHEDALAVCHADPQYLYASITWNMDAVKETSDERLERIFVHELMHIHLAEMRGEDGVTQQEERVATELALSFVFLHRSMETG